MIQQLQCILYAKIYRHEARRPWATCPGRLAPDTHMVRNVLVYVSRMRYSKNSCIKSSTHTSLKPIERQILKRPHNQITIPYIANNDFVVF